ncbi:hypothetical protein F4802DRAFT_569547 [Xylaria palmicola]|nr:hypothetical protein F4802DRAFT_569547 [Xylaria palmicola]
MSTTSQLSLLAVLLAGANALAVDYGSWAVNVTSASAASGYRYGSVTAEYSATPGVFGQASWLYDAPTFNWTYTYTPEGFKASRVDNAAGDQPITIWQNVTLDGAVVELTGSGVVNMNCNSASGRGCAGSGVVRAVLNG